MCGNCGHPGPQHAVAIPLGVPLPKRCLDQCARCRQEAREEQQRAESDAR